MKNSDTVIGILIMAFSALGIIYVQYTDMQSLVGLSPGAFPQLIFALMALCGFSIFFEARRQTVNVPVNFSWKNPILVVGLLAVYSYALEYVGFIIATIAFLLAALYLFEEKRPKILVSVPLVAAMAIYYMFTEFFLIPLP